MNIRNEIAEYARDEDKPVLLWLFERYHLASQWPFVARCNHERYGKMSYEANRVWYPTKEGRALYAYNELTEWLEWQIEVCKGSIIAHKDDENWESAQTRGTINAYDLTIDKIKRMNNGGGVNHE